MNGGFAFFREATLAGREVTPEELLRIGAIHGISSDSKPLDNNGRRISRPARAMRSSISSDLQRVDSASLGPVRVVNSKTKFIEQTFDKMMVPGSEGDFGIKQFQRKIKNIDWAQFWTGGRARL